MRPMREYPPAPQLTAGDEPDERWNKRTCAEFPGLWDYDHHGETTAQRDLRHEIAAADCLDCPALDLCLAMNHDGATGVIAGRVIKP